MIPFDFDYYLPDSLKEATDIFGALQREGKNPIYYAGGTEIISMARVFNIRPGAVIDIKKIPECTGMGTDGERLSFGAAVTMSDIYEANYFPLLGLAAGRIADHTVQVRLTLGGNLAGTIIYHETMLPLMLADAAVYISSPAGDREVPIKEALSNGKALSPGELIVRVSVDKQYASMPCSHVKKSRSEKIGYPVVSLSAIYIDGDMRSAVSGLVSYPYRFNDLSLKNKYSAASLAQRLLREAPSPVIDDVYGSAGYREFVFEKTAENMIINFRKS
jgi:CO/xanthine dehydrogenase FAD-binding subunit